MGNKSECQSPGTFKNDPRMTESWILFPAPRYHFLPSCFISWNFLIALVIWYLLLHYWTWVAELNHNASDILYWKTGEVSVPLLLLDQCRGMRRGELWGRTELPVVLLSLKSRVISSKFLQLRFSCLSYKRDNCSYGVTEYDDRVWKHLTADSC